MWKFIISTIYFRLNSFQPIKTILFSLKKYLCDVLYRNQILVSLRKTISNGLIFDLLVTNIGIIHKLKNCISNTN